MTLAQENSILSLIGTEPDGLMPIEVQKLMFVFSFNVRLSPSERDTPTTPRAVVDFFRTRK